MKIVFDTYAWIEYFNNTKEGRIVASYLEKDEIITPSVVLLELSYKADEKGLDIKRQLEFIKIKSHISGINQGFVLKFGKIYNDAKKKVKGIGLADCIVLATAKLHDAKVLTGDPHFSKFKEGIVLR